VRWKKPSNRKGERGKRKKWLTASTIQKKELTFVIHVFVKGKLLSSIYFFNFLLFHYRTDRKNNLKK